MTAKALAGWKRQRSRHGIILTLQLVRSAEDFRAAAFEEVDVALNDRQLRSLIRDLTRAAQNRGLEPFTVERWWRFWR